MSVVCPSVSRPSVVNFLIFDFSETAERNSTKLYRKQNLNVLYQQARIQEFSSGGGGVQPSEIFWQAKKKNRQKGEREGGGLQYLFCFSMKVDIPAVFSAGKNTFEMIV